jgi:hypothetical protein
MASLSPCRCSQSLLFRQLHHAAHHRQVGVGAVDVEFADRGIAVFLQAFLDMADHGFIAHPA